MILETYLYSFDIIRHVVPFALRENTNEISEKNIKDYSLVKKYSERLYLMHKAMYESYTEK